MDRITRALLAGVASLGLALGACVDAADTEQRLAELRSERRSLLMQFTSAQNAIRGYQNRALDEPGARAAVDTFYSTFRATVERDDPEALELLDRAEAVGADLALLSTPVLLEQGQDDPRLSDEERRAVANELAEVERQLRPVIQRTFADPEVQSRFQTLQDSVIAGILRQDPAARRSLELMSRLERQMMEVDREIARLEGS